MNALVLVIVALVFLLVTAGAEMKSHRVRRRFTAHLPAMKFNADELRRSVYEGSREMVPPDVCESHQSAWQPPKSASGRPDAIAGRRSTNT